MARGFDSKNVEEQQAEAERKSELKRIQVTKDELQLQEKRRSLQLDIARVRASMEQSANERYKVMLQRALEDLNAKLKSL